MSTTGLVLDDYFQRHRTGAGHPERPERLQAIADAFAESGIVDACLPIARVAASREVILRVHDEAYLQRVERACRDGQPFIDTPDSAICEASWEVALQAAGAVLNAVDAVQEGRAANAFCAIRPPGHHAEHAISMGFCLINNIAVAARQLIDTHGLERVLILDWDVHHGNGTQHAFERDPRVLFISLHGHPGILYPGTGYEYERGSGPGEGFTLNIPMMAHQGDADYRRAFDEKILPAIDRYRPEFVLVSCGFDAHRLDPLAPLTLETDSFGWMTDFMVDVASRHCSGKLVSMLEGGYHLGALAESSVIHVQRLMGA